MQDLSQSSPVEDVPPVTIPQEGGVRTASPPSDVVALEAFQTPRWAVEAVLDVELLPTRVIEPCVGLGALAGPLLLRGHDVRSVDIRDWRAEFPQHVNEDWRIIGCEEAFSVMNFLTEFKQDLSNAAVFMNPPFSLATEFVDRARELGARKIICFQRQAWRESEARRAWWSANRPARVYVCGARANVWRFDLLECNHVEGTAGCPNFGKTKRVEKTIGCLNCLGSSTTAHAFYVWERGHAAAEIGNAIFPKEAKHG